MSGNRGNTAVLLIALTACISCDGHRDAVPASVRHAVDNAPVQQKPRSPWTQLPAHQRLPMAQSFSTSHASSWEELLSRQPPASRQYLESVNYRYFGIFAFENSEERDYLISAGFPTAEEWLAAQEMEDEALREMADQGNRKAVAFYADRMAMRFRDLNAAEAKIPNWEAERLLAASRAIAYATRAREGGVGPYPAYVEGFVKSTVQGAPEPFAAAFFAARERGDMRVSKLIRAYAERHPELNVGAIYVTLEGM